MKNLLISLSLICILSFNLQAKDKYTEVMLKTIPTVYQAQTLEEHQNVINKLTRIAEAETDKWEPYYYIAYSYCLMSFKEKDAETRDNLISQAQEAIDQAKEITPTESEVTTLQGFIHTASLVVDPGIRGQQYSGMSMQSFGKALSQDPKNPRALYLKGQMMMGTAQFMGGSTADACMTIKESIKAFENYTSENPLAPTWGKAQAEQIAKNCQ